MTRYEWLTAEQHVYTEVYITCVYWRIVGKQHPRSLVRIDVSRSAVDKEG
jgi:hypothetical protein